MGNILHIITVKSDLMANLIPKGKETESYDWDFILQL